MASRLPTARALGLVLWSVAVVSLATTAQAAPSAAERETARALMDEGDRLREAHDTRAALARYQAAHAIMHVPTTGLDLARVQAELGLLVEARASAVEVVNLPESGLEPEVFREARRAALALVGELEPRVPSLQTMIVPKRADYNVTVDNVTLPRHARDVAFRTNPGSHRVRVTAPGYTTIEQRVTLAEGEVRTLRLTLVEAPVMPVDTRAEAARVRGIVGLSVGGAALALGAVTGVLSVVETNRETKGCDAGHCYVDRASRLSHANTLANVTNISVPIGVLAAAYGIYELVTQPRPVDTRIERGVHLDLGLTQLTLRGAL